MQNFEFDRLCKKKKVLNPQELTSIFNNKYVLVIKH